MKGGMEEGERGRKREGGQGCLVITLPVCLVQSGGVEALLLCKVERGRYRGPACVTSPIQQC